MCGVSGFVGANREAAAAFVRRANQLQSHRGPDGEGVWQGDGIALGHRRLAILDLTPTGSQPMASDDGRWVIAYNGEIYNHEELRTRYLSDVRFRGRSDTETLLALLSRKGPEALSQMVGMWAILLWDNLSRRLLMSRDRYGQKPMYWRRGTDGSVRIASEIKPLLDPDERPASDHASLADYLASGNYGHLGTRTFFDGIKSFPPGSWAVVSAGDHAPTPTRYWRFPFAGSRPDRVFDSNAAAELKDLVNQAVCSQLMSDVPLGATLSGGLDSSIVVGTICASERAAPLAVFTAQTPGSRFDETRYVEAVRLRWGNRLVVHSTRLDGRSFRPAILETIRQQEEPFGDPSIIAHGFLMDAARRAGIPVVLGGQGADELFLGYRHMQYAAIAGAIRKGKLAWAFSQVAALEGTWGNLPRMLLAAFFPRVEARLRENARRSRSNLLGPALIQNLPEQGGVLGWGKWQEVWRATIEGVGLPHLVHYDDRSAMARGIEGRMPFLDHRIADFVARLDVTAFLQDGLSKWPLRSACADVVPAEVLGRRDKIGFFTPLADLLQRERDWVRDVLLGDEFVALRWLDPRAITRLLAHPGPGRAWSSEGMLPLWRAFCAALWASEFRVSA